MNKFFILIFIAISLAFQSSKNKTIDKGIYISTYSETLRNPVKVTYSVYKFQGNDTITRTGMNFYSEPGIITASSKDFVGNNYDKGHLAPAETFSQSKERMKLTFSYVNCAVQHYQLNRGLWSKLENQERKWSQSDSLIVTVNIKFDKPAKKLPTGTAIPSEFVKTIKFYYTKKTKRYKFPNNECKGELSQYEVK